MSEVLLSIIIPQYNLARMTEDCVYTLQNLNLSIPHEIIVVDNGSTDKISPSLAHEIVYIESKENLMFSGGCNLGAAAARGTVLCFLNNDVIVYEGIKECVEKLLESEQHGIVGPKLLYPDGKIQHAGVRVIGTKPYENIFDHIYRNLPSDYLPANMIREYQAVTGACIFIRKTDFDRVGGFSTEFKNGYEDSDLCMNIIHGLGKKVIYFPHTNMVHLENKTPRNNTNSFNKENHIIFCEKWSDKLRKDALRWLEADLTLS